MGGRGRLEVEREGGGRAWGCSREEEVGGGVGGQRGRHGRVGVEHMVVDNQAGQFNAALFVLDFNFTHIMVLLQTIQFGIDKSHNQT